MSKSPPMGIIIALAIAGVFHAAFFLMVRPQPSDTFSGGAPTVPKTFYLSSGRGNFAMSGPQVRTVASPVLFSLPSSMGFSRELYEQKIQTPRFLPKPATPEQFLEADPVAREVGLDAKRLMLTSILSGAPELPQDVYGAAENRPSARRVNLAPELKKRIVGGVRLPASLNQEVSTAWEIRAQLHIAANGFVKHVFIEQPLESAPLNMEILKLLYGLQFNPGEPLDGIVEIYSPESSKPAEGERL